MDSIDVSISSKGLSLGLNVAEAGCASTSSVLNDGTLRSFVCVCENATATSPSEKKTIVSMDFLIDWPPFAYGISSQYRQRLRILSLVGTEFRQTQSIYGDWLEPDAIPPVAWFESSTSKDHVFNPSHPFNLHPVL